MNLFLDNYLSIFKMIFFCNPIDFTDFKFANIPLLNDWIWLSCKNKDVIFPTYLNAFSSIVEIWFAWSCNDINLGSEGNTGNTGSSLFLSIGFKFGYT